MSNYQKSLIERKNELILLAKKETNLRKREKIFTKIGSIEYRLFLGC